MRKLEGLAVGLLAVALLIAAWLWDGGTRTSTAVAHAPAPLLIRRPPPPKPDQELLLGVWKVVKGDASGKHLPRDVSTLQRWTFTRGLLTIDYGDGEPGKVSYKLDPAARPRAVDLKFNEGLWRGSTFHGIYLLTGNRLKVCYTRAVGRRPPDFDQSREDRGTVWLELERVRPAR
jgi:uncharacterized protein (TIGR03067 family)